jgi:hypothetical protein
VVVPRYLGLGFLLLAAVLAVAACAGPGPSFDPSGPCTGDGSAVGAYPDLEALVPTGYQGGPPERLDSGRSCTPANLGSMAAAGITEVRYAGGTWTFGGERAIVLAVFSAPGLTADILADFYADSAGKASRTQIVGVTAPTLAGRPGRRLDTTTGDRQQTVVIWPAAMADHVNVIVTNSLPDTRIDEAVDAFKGR